MLKFRKGFQAIVGSFLWVTAASLFFFRNGNILSFAVLCIGGILLEVSSRDFKETDGVLGRLWYMFYFLAFAGLAQVASSHRGYIQIVSVLFSNLFLYIGSSVASIVYAVILLREEMANAGVNTSKNANA
ncbi:hypothetical protein [Reinekea sp. G2M2-21]|uniref:hypothetical protein n=1 Tax=Reinekea sp. G2M2-21 TaxID=2788942 RepID=UPI0018A9F26F|nr:hypothetical protein [Reinekea sp. G2M2-21]